MTGYVRAIATLLVALLLVLITAYEARAQDELTPIEVTVGLYVNDIQAVDLRTHSYGMDFYVWFRWDNPDYDPTLSFEFMNTFDPEAHVETVLYDEPQSQPDGSLYQIVRHQGLFTTKFPVGDYPFDHQTLIVSLEDSEFGSGDLQFVADTRPLTLNPEIRLPGFRLGEPQLVIRDKPYPTAFGDLSQPDVAAYSRAEFLIPVTRPAVSGILKTFVPVLLIILCAAFALLLDPEHVEARIGLAITALLTLVAMQFTMLSGLPEVAYLTLLDQVYLLSYLYILVVIAIVVRGTRVDERGAIRGGAGATIRLIESGPRSALFVTGAYLAAILLVIVINLA